MNLIDASNEIVKKIFPNETWEEQYTNITVKRIKQIIAGVLKDKNNEGKLYCYITRLDALYIWNMQDLKQNKAPEGALSLPQADINQNSDNINITHISKKSREARK